MLFIVLLWLVFAWGGNAQDIDVLPEEEITAIDITTQAYINNPGDLAIKLGSVEEYDSLASDLHVFAKKNFSVYNEAADRVVGFRLNKSSVKSGDVVSFSGRYGASKDRIDVKITLLKNDRIKTSITNTKTNKNFDGDLPSNSRRNQFLASLPIDEQDYRIDYFQDGVGGGVTVTYYVRNRALTEVVYKKIVEAMGEEEAKKLTIKATFPSASFEQ
jgi:hypothetical protein